MTGKNIRTIESWWLSSEQEKMRSQLVAQFMPFFRLIARILMFCDNKYRILMFCDKKYSILMFHDKKKRISMFRDKKKKNVLTIRDKTESCSTVLQQSRVMFNCFATKHAKDVRSERALFCNHPPRGPESELEIARVTQRESE